VLDAGPRVAIIFVRRHFKAALERAVLVCGMYFVLTENFKALE
jgi:hypothetical protein